MGRSYFPGVRFWPTRAHWGWHAESAAYATRTLRVRRPNVGGRMIDGQCELKTIASRDLIDNSLSGK